jgi:methyl-accepting chemotaxis protein
MPPQTRSRYLVNRSQVVLFSLNLFYFGVAVALLGTALSAPRILPADPDSAFLRLSPLEAIVHSIQTNIWPLTALFAVVFCLHSLLLAHRVLGPLVRFRRAFGEIRAGRLAQRIVLRDKDYHVEEAELFNEMMDTLSHRLHGVKRRYDQAQEELKALEQALEQENGALEHARALRRRIQACDEEWSWFELAPCAVELGEHKPEPRPTPRGAPRAATPSRRAS